MMFTQRTLVFTLIIAVFLSAAAFATKYKAVAGKWKSSTGATITIPDVPGDFTIIYEHPDKRIDHFKGSWYQEDKGQRFWFKDEKGNKRICTVETPNSIKVADDKGQQKATWVKE
jgi:hypothetical protein